jgi:hypothetical protein
MVNQRDANGLLVVHQFALRVNEDVVAFLVRQPSTANGGI